MVLPATHPFPSRERATSHVYRHCDRVNENPKRHSRLSTLWWWWYHTIVLLFCTLRAQKGAHSPGKKTSGSTVCRDTSWYGMVVPA